MVYQFPFGEPVRRLEQQDRTAKPVFVIGVYASAVHAKWINLGKTICQALAVARESEYFESKAKWRRERKRAAHSHTTAAQLD